MKVVVSGGSGLAGFEVVRYLSQHDFEVLSIDRVRPSSSVATYKLIDCEDIGQLYGVLAGADAIVHLAAIPRPTFHTPEQVFRTNVMATYNILEVAATLEIKRVVYVSSMSVLGLPFYSTPVVPQYVPIDEDHPKLPQDAYALSKYLGEEIAEGFVRRTAGRISIVSLRFPWIHTSETFKAQLVPFWDDPAGGISNLWSYIDTRDVAQACHLALQANILGHEPFFVSAKNSFMNQDIVPLVREFYPQTEILSGLAGNRSLFNIEKAERILGYDAQFSWESYF